MGSISWWFSEVHFDCTFVILGQHILDTSDIGVLLQETNQDFQNLSKSNGKDLSWDSDGVRYTADSKDLKITWVLDPDFLHYMDGHPTHAFKGKFSIFEIEIVQNRPVPTDLLSKYGFEAAGDRYPDIPTGEKWMENKYHYQSGSESRSCYS